MIKRISTVLLMVMISAGQAVAEGDAKSGKKVFKKCKACHSLKPEDNKVGPTLYMIVGAPSGAVDGFKYSKSLETAELIWDAETLDEFLAKPKKVVPGTKMAFSGLKKPEQIDDLIAYLTAEGEK